MISTHLSLFSKRVTVWKKCFCNYIVNKNAFLRQFRKGKGIKHFSFLPLPFLDIFTDRKRVLVLEHFYVININVLFAPSLLFQNIRVYFIYFKKDDAS